MTMAEKSSHTTAFDVRGMRLRVAADHEWVLRRMRMIVGPYESPLCETNYALWVRRSNRSLEDAPPPGMEESWRGELPGGIPGVGFRNGSRRALLLPGKLLLLLNPDERAAEVQYSEPEEWRINLGGILPVLCEFLAQRRNYVIHAASLIRDGKAVVLLGKSGMGKTSAALALALDGYRLLTDDASFLHRPEKGELAVWGLPRPLKIHKNTIAMLPRLAPLCSGPETVDGEYMVPLEKIPNVDIMGHGKPAMLIFLEPRNDITHHLAPLDSIQALTRLAGENVRAVDQRAEGIAGNAFKAFVEMAGACACWQLSAGPNLSALPERIDSLLRGTHL